MRTVWLEDCAQEEQRESEEEDAEAAIAEHEKDRPGLEGARRRRKFLGGLRRIVDHGGSLLAPGRPRPT